ncbi:mechanosensitive ion channel [Shewanella submarina]|uniref:Mechanosensitive ion channel domain-containing protein n=1 Tax=Shewanella submarina TaxID=2016376 RepID=A0ABV7G8Y2_9GAMM|nr:mechanosensitive ion channel domain-containing protein [Shewanella submarina]MCL1038639.1 mechanosensitive ion channel [Shewanella submarina]
MTRILLLLLCLLPALAQANPTLGLDKRLGMNSNQTQELTQEQKLAQLQEKIALLKQAADSYNRSLMELSSQRLNLAEQQRQTQQPLPVEREVALRQQASLAHLRLSELKESESLLGKQINTQLERQKQLPGLIRDARDTALQNQRTSLLPADSPAGALQHAQRQLYQQQLLTLEAELDSSPARLEMAQMQLQLVRAQLHQQELQIETLNQAISARQQSNTDATLASNIVADDQLTDPIAIEINKVNLELGDQLKALTSDINQTLKAQAKAETQYQQQAKQLTNIQEQITWVKVNSAFGDRFLQMLQALPKPPSPEKLQGEIADTRLARYHVEQLQVLNQQDLSEIDITPEQQKLLNSQQVLIGRLLEAFDLYLAELAKLKLSYEQLTQQYETLKSTLNEHLFWVPNANAIGKLWLTELHRSTVWLAEQAPWQQLPKALDEQQHLWAWWIILLVLCLMVQDLLAPKYTNTLNGYAANVGNVTQDNFIYTFKALLVSAGYSLIWPMPIIAAGLIFYGASHNFVQAVGMGIVAMGCLQLLYRFYTLLAQDKGVLIAHFGRPPQVMQDVSARLHRFVWLATPLLGLMGFTEVLDSSPIRNSLGRGAFIIFCIQLFMLYKDALTISRRFRQSGDEDGKNKKLLHRVLWLTLLLVPLVSAVLALLGYYFTAFQMLLQLQLSLVLGLSFLLIYQLIRRWMLIERRRIAFDRAKARRAEILAQREKGETPNSDQLDTYEEPVVDLETISSQSLGLVRSLLLLALLASLIGLWSQTHTALFSFLDGVTLWTSNTSINGIEQQVPVTLKSVFFGLIIFAFSLMIATNLPGLLELMILQRLELSPGTGFAITTVSRYLVVLFGTLVGFSTLGMEWNKLQWLIAALSVGLGFGLQEIFANFISGLIILFEKPVRIGDTVTIRDLTGTVSKIQIRATTIIDWDRKEIIVPNKAFITEQLINWSLSDPITRVIINVAVSRDSDPAKVEASLYQAVKECNEALEIPEPEVWFAGFGQHTQDYEVRAYARDMNARWPLRHALHKLISKKLKENNLELAYPQLEIHLSPQQRDSGQGLIR